MKKVVVAFLLVIVGFGTTMAQSRLAHVDTQRILDTMPSRKAAMKELENFERRAGKELQETQQQIQSLAQKLEAERTTMSPTAAKFEENRLNKKYQEFTMRQQELEQQIQILSQELNEPILDRIQKAIEKVCLAEGIDYVIDESALLFSKGKNITDKVIEEVLKLERETPIVKD